MQCVLLIPVCLRALWKHFSVSDKQAVGNTNNCLRTHCSYVSNSSCTAFTDADGSALRERSSSRQLKLQLYNKEVAIANLNLQRHVVWHVAFENAHLHIKSRWFAWASLIACHFNRNRLTWCGSDPQEVNSWSSSHFLLSLLRACESMWEHNSGHTHKK